MTLTAEIEAGQLAELVRQVQAGNEVLLTQGNKPVAKIIPTPQEASGQFTELRVHSFRGHRVLTPLISQAGIAEEIFERK